jgi:transglutaminase-like putative cysteine protease
MYYQVSHNTTYTYNQSVILKPHILRLYPRSDGWQKLYEFNLEINPNPSNISYFNDLDGNTLIKVWFTEPTEQLSINIHSKVETYKNNPFNYLLEPWAMKLPFDYPVSLLSQLQPYLNLSNPDPFVTQLAQEIYHETNGEIGSFLFSLNQKIYQNCEYITRENGAPWSAGITWSRKQGSCRDFVVLFMEVCKSMGLATRFVSGYQEGDPDQTEHDLHAWVEVYLPGGGWRGYDPTHGLAVGDRHVVLVASIDPSYTTPVFGAVSPVIHPFQGGIPVESRLEVDLSLRTLENEL